tara:strand:- start:2864 stop:3349 length:486 start_codon:yes stop_codon:yes gene_type:complete
MGGRVAVSRVHQLWFRYCDRELTRKVMLPELESAEWNAWVGTTGERLARKQIWSNGGKVLYLNYRPTGGGEIDIVARDGDTLVFTEVKTRTSERYGRPADAVDRKKQQLIIRGANAWLRELNLPEVQFRFDVIEVLLFEGQPPDIRVIEAAFTSPQTGLGM